MKTDKPGRWPSPGVANLQDLAHPANHDYEAGSPHLLHPQLRNKIVQLVRDAVSASLRTTGKARVLELGAGHGAFTDPMLAAGASVTVTEMSKASADLLARRYEFNRAAEVFFDSAGDIGSSVSSREFDLIVCLSVLHHIPDYLAAIDDCVALLQAGGSFISFQDPLFYPRRSRLNMAADRGAYYFWRLLQGDLREGAKTVSRRVRKVVDEESARDMVEYHVIRSGVDEAAIASSLVSRFGSVDVVKYWSTQARSLQRLGENFNFYSTFGVVATNKL